MRLFLPFALTGALLVISGCSAGSTYASPYELSDVITDSPVRCFADDPLQQPEIVDMDNGWILECEGWTIRLLERPASQPSAKFCDELRTSDDERLDSTLLVAASNWFADADGGQWPLHAALTSVSDALDGTTMTWREHDLKNC